VTIAVEMMAINKHPFMITMSININFGTAELIRDKTKNTLMTSITKVVRHTRQEVSECVIYYWTAPLSVSEMGYHR